MVDFLIYRACDLTDLGVRQILLRSADQVDRGIALLEGDAGVPNDPADGSDNPTLDIGNANWSDPVPGEGTLPPGTYDYDIIPVDTCTGRTGQPIALPPLTITGVNATGIITPVRGDDITDGDTFVLDDGVNPAVTFEFNKGGNAPATGSITSVPPADLLPGVDTETFTLDDGTNPAVTFVFDDDGSVVPTPTLRAISYDSGDTLGVMSTLTADAINAAPTLNITAEVADSGGTVALTHTTNGTIGNQAITETVLTPLFQVSGMSGGAGQDESATLRFIVVATDTATTVGGRIAEAINAAPTLNITATGSSSVDLTNTTPGAAGNIPIVQGGTQPLTIEGMSGGSTLGATAILDIEFNTRPTSCDGAQLRRDGVIVGPVFPLESNVPDNLTVVVQNEVDGTYTNGSREGFTRTGGADLIAGDVVEYNGYTVSVSSVIAPDVFFEPKIPADLSTPDGFFDAANRSGFYEAFSTMWGVQIPGIPLSVTAQYAPSWPPGSNIYWPGPLMSFKLVPPISPFPFLNDIQAGDVIMYGSKTGLVIYVERNPIPQFPPTPQFGTVLVLPFGILPIPPLPAGQFWVVYRPELTPTFGFYYSCDDPARVSPISPDFPGVADFNDTVPTLLRGGVATPPDATTFIKIGNPSYDPGDMTTDNKRTNAFRVVGNGELPIPGNGPPTALAENQSLIIDGQIVTVSRVFEIIPPGGTPSNPLPGFPGEYEIQFTAELSPDPQQVFPGVDFDRPISPVGPWATIPSFDSPYLKVPVIPAAGNFKRLSRASTISNQQDTWQWEENGDYQDRAGDVEGTEARNELDFVLSQNAYPGGLQGLFDTLRGPTTNAQSDVFVTTNGDVTLAGGKVIATNDIANLGTGDLIDLGTLRSLLENMCDSMTVMQEVVTVVETAGFAVLKLEAQEVVVEAPSCPPGQPSTTETRLVCVGVATTVEPLGADEFAHVYWSETGRQIANLGVELEKLGLTRAESVAAMNLTTSNRVVRAEVIPTETINQSKIIVDVGTEAEVNNIINDTRIIRINTGTLSRDQVRAILGSRGRAGIVNRAPGTDPATKSEDWYSPIHDFLLKAHEFASLSFVYNESFNVCDYDAALASLPEGDLKNNVAAFFAVVENTVALIQKAGRALTDWLGDQEFKDANATIGGIVTATDVDPALNCLAGPQGQTQVSGSGQTNLGTIRQVDNLVSAFAPNFQTRFNLSKLFGQAISASLCSVQEAYERAVTSVNGTGDSAAFSKVAIGCLPSVQEVVALNIGWPSVDVQVAFECSLDLLNILTDVTNALIAEANEVLSLGVSFEAGFITRVSEAANRACNSSDSLDNLIAGLTNQLIGQ